MKFIFRTDASINIGSGHVMRCLALADELRKHGASCIFICRLHKGHLNQLINERGYEVKFLPEPNHSFKYFGDLAHSDWLGVDCYEDAAETKRVLDNTIVDWLIVDHYALDWHWEAAMRLSYKNLMVIDDLADRRHDCDLLLDQNLGRVAKDYSGLLKRSSKMLLGAKYALLRSEFSEWRDYSLARRRKIQLKKLLITMGGVDSFNVTGKVLDALKECELPADLQIKVVMGKHAPWLREIEMQVKNLPWSIQVLFNVNNMAELMANSDLAIGGAGSSAWERCCLGLPTIQFALSDNQKFISEALNKVGAAVSIDLKKLPYDLCLTLKKFVRVTFLRPMALYASQIVDGNGCERVCSHLMNGSR